MRAARRVSDEAVEAGLSKAFAGVLASLPAEQSLRVMEVLSGAEHHDRRSQQGGLLRGSQYACGARIVGVFGSGHTGGISGLDLMIEREEAARAKREFHATPTQCELRAEAMAKLEHATPTQRELIAAAVTAMNGRGMRVPVSMLLTSMNAN